MAETLSTSLVKQKNRMHDLSPWVWLFEIQFDATNAIRIAGHDKDFTHNGNVYSPFPVAVAVQSRDGRGVLADLEVTVSNFQQVVAAQVEAGNFLGKRVTVRLVSTSAPNEAIHEGVYVIKEATVTSAVVTFVVGVHNLFAAQFPSQRYNRTRCRHIYGKAGCNYDTTLPNLISGPSPLFVPAKCDLGLDTSNGCRVHGDNEVANGVPRRHPLNFGGFPGIPKGPSRV